MKNKRRKWPWILGGTIAIAVIFGFAMFEDRPVQQVEVSDAQMRAVAPSILASGTLAYESEVRMVPEVIGRVREVLVAEGDVVAQGQLLLRLDPATYRAEIAQLEAAQRQSQLNVQRARVNRERQAARWKRYEALRGGDIVDANTYEEVASQHQLAEVELSSGLEMLRQTEAQLELARERLAKTEFCAPIGGTVTALFIKAGETAVPSAMSIAGSDLMVVANTNSMNAEINVDETDVARVSVGQRARIVPAAFPDKGWSGTVERVALSPRQKPGESKSYLVKIRLEHQADIQFRSGMSCRPEIATRQSDVQATLAVPIQAVRYAELDDEERSGSAKASVFVADGNTVRLRDIETGVSDDAYIEVRRGLKTGERVVTGPAKTLRQMNDGDRITAAPATLAAR